jgi:ppGpp synthetase/RelA/SpoT-type nucleotidyltranferase
MELLSKNLLINQYIKKAENYFTISMLASNLLIKEIAKSSIDIFSIDQRVKSLPSIIEKITRKEYKSIDDITDRVGIRIICVYLKDIEKIIEIIKNCFFVDRIEDATLRGGTSSFGYSSYHCLVKWAPNREGPIFYEDLPKYRTHYYNGRPIEEEKRKEILENINKINNEMKDYILEIQVRTILQHAWASISHKVLYKNDSNIDDKTKRRMARLAAILEETDEIFSKEISTINKSKNNRKTLNKSRKLTQIYIKKYSEEALEMKINSYQTKDCLNIFCRLGVNFIEDFDEVMASTIEALNAAFSDIRIKHLKEFYYYIYALKYWIAGDEVPFSKPQIEVIDWYRFKIDQNSFQKVLRKINNVKE